MRFLTSAAIAALLLSPLAAQAQISDNTVKIGILNDQSGVYADFGGKWSYEAAKMAVEDFGGKVPTRRSRSSPPTTRTSRTSPRTSPGSGTTPTRSTPSWS